MGETSKDPRACGQQAGGMTELTEEFDAMNDTNGRPSAQPTPIGDLLRQWVRDNAPDDTCPAPLLDKSWPRPTTQGDFNRDSPKVDS